MRPLLLLFVVTATLARGSINTPPEAFSPKERSQRFSDRVILAKPHAAQRAKADAAEAREGVRVRHKFTRFGDVRVIDVADGVPIATAIARLEATGRYEFVERDYIESPDALPNDTSFSVQWSLNNTGQLTGSTVGADIKAVAAWDTIHDAANIVVAVVDTGFNLTHRELTPNLWRNPAPTFGDVNGAAFLRGVRSGNVTDEYGHGSHVAGIIGAAGNNSLGISGVAWKVQLMAVKNSDATGSSSTSDSAMCIDYAIANGAQIINCSFGGSGYSQTFLTALRAARDAGVIVVTSAGNDGLNNDVSSHYPSSYLLDNIVAVGNSGSSDLASTSSDFGGLVELYAPGSSILSLDYLTTTGLVTKSGTSMAAPHVTGAMALIKAQFPNDTPRQLINRLLRSTDRSAGFTGRAQTGGRLNLARAVTSTSNRPFNDEFENRAVLVGSGATMRTSNVGATAETGEPAHAGLAAGNTLWWQWTAANSGTVTLTTRGSDYDTVIAVYTGSAVNSLTRVAANDDADGQTTSRLTFAAELGQTYYFAVGGKNGAAGLTIVSYGTAPANDDFANATVLPSKESTRATGSNRYATLQAGEPRILSVPGGASVWYRWTAPRAGRFQASAFSTTDTLLGVYTGSAVDNLTTVAASDDTGIDGVNSDSLCSFVATAGTTYAFKVDMKDPLRTDDFTLTVTDALWQFSMDGSASGSPAVATDGTIYMGGGSPDANLYAISPDGTLKWTYKTGGSVSNCSPAIARNGTIFFGASDGHVTALKPDGKVLWDRALDAGSVSVSPAIGNDGIVYLHGTDGYLYALDPTTGATRWRTAVGALTFASAAVGPDGTIYQPSDSGYLYALRPDGTRKWRFTSNGDTFSTPALDAAGNIYYTTYSTATLVCVTPAGTLRWQFSGAAPTYVSTSPTLSADGSAVYFGASNQNFYAVNTVDGSQRWQLDLEDSMLSSTAAIDSNGTIYVGCYDNRIYAINPNGTVRRSWDTAMPVRSSPTIVGRTLYIGSGDAKLYALDIGATAANGTWTQYRRNSSRTGEYSVGALALTLQPQPVTTIVSQPYTLSVAATSNDPLTFQWNKDGVAIPGASYATYIVPVSAASDAGAYTVKVANAQGSVTSTAVTVTLDPLIAPRVANFSVRAVAGPPPAQMLTVAFTVGSGAVKPLLLRGVGPTLANFGVTGALPDPQMQLLAGATVLSANDNWGGDTALAAAATRVSAFPLGAGSNDAAVVRSVSAGTYTVQIWSANASTGNALAEIYDTDPVSIQATGLSRMTNLSARAQVGTGGAVMFAGFTVVGNVPKTLLLRAIGPTLSTFGVSGALSDPMLEVYRGSTLIGLSDDWGGSTTLRNAFSQAGAFPLATTSRDAAVMLTLSAGVYTARISGFGSGTGVALFEIYDLQ